MNKTKCRICGKSLRGYRIESKYCGEKCRATKYKADYEKRKADGTFDHITRERFAIFQRDHFRCIYCGRSSIEDNIKLHLEHIIAKKNGGSNEAMNLVTSCSECNISKNDSQLDKAELVRIISVVMDRNLSCGISNTRKIAIKLSDM